MGAPVGARKRKTAIFAWPSGSKRSLLKSETGTREGRDKTVRNAWQGAHLPGNRMRKSLNYVYHKNLTKLDTQGEHKKL